MTLIGQMEILLMYLEFQRSDYAREFQRGHRSFLGPGDNNGSITSQKENETSKPVKWLKSRRTEWSPRIPRRRCAEPRNVAAKSQDETLHFTEDSRNIELTIRTIHWANQLRLQGAEYRVGVLHLSERMQGPGSRGKLVAQTHTMVRHDDSRKATQHRIAQEPNSSGGISQRMNVLQNWWGCEWWMDLEILMHHAVNTPSSRTCPDSKAKLWMCKYTKDWSCCWCQSYQSITPLMESRFQIPFIIWKTKPKFRMVRSRSSNRLRRSATTQSTQKMFTEEVTQECVKVQDKEHFQSERTTVLQKDRGPVS